MTRLPPRTGEDFDISPLNTIESPIDQQAVEYAIRFGQLTSRRGFLAKCGRVMLGVLGITAVSALPILDIVSEVDAATTCNGTWNLCGLSGKTCQCCAGGGLNVCPAGSNWFGYWARCCSTPYGGRGMIYYWDCCGGPANCGGAACLWCHNNGDQPAWCNGQPNYKCTAAVTGSSC
jgi:hypothetical protein